MSKSRGVTIIPRSSWLTNKTQQNIEYFFNKQQFLWKICQNEINSEHDNEENKKTLFNLSIPFKMYLEFEPITIPFK